MLPSSPPTDPDVPDYGIRFLVSELRPERYFDRAGSPGGSQGCPWGSTVTSSAWLSIVVSSTEEMRFWSSPLCPADGLTGDASLPSVGSR
jgi:hypothetical protein